MLKRLTWAENRVQLVTLLKILVQTRDIVDGKGEYDLAYMQILVWYNYYPTLAFNMFVVPQYN